MGTRGPKEGPEHPPTAPTFGEPPPRRRKGRQQPTAPMFPEGDDLPLFSGTPQTVTDRPYVPQDHSFKQQLLPGMPPIDYEHVYRTDRERNRKRSREPAGPSDATLWDQGGADTADERGAEGDIPIRDNPRQAVLHQALSVYNLRPEELRRLAPLGEQLHEVLRHGEAPQELHHLLTALSHLLRPRQREQIKSPADVAGLLMVEMGHLDQEELRTVLLDVFVNRKVALPHFA